MGWKIAAAITALNGRSLEAAVSDVYGRKKKLVDCDETVDTVLFPDDDNLAYALSFEGFSWVFDWPFVLNSVGDGYSGKHDLLFFMLMSITDLYGFAEYREGKEVRRRAGSADDGLYCDLGAQYSIESDVLKEHSFSDQFEQAQAAWRDPTQIFMSEDGEMNHASIGEEVVFALMKEKLGFRLDMSSPLSDPFIDLKVQRIS